MRRRLQLKLEKKQDTNLLAEIAAVILAILAAMIVSGLLIKIAGASPLEGIANLLKGGFGGRKQILESIVRATPLILTGLATVIAFRGKIWSIGQEGQLFAGAMMSYWIMSQMGNQTRFIGLALVILAGFVGGALLGLVSGLMKAYFNVDIIISTVLLNFIINDVILLLLYNHQYWMDPTQFYPRSAAIPEILQYPILFQGYRIHLGVIIAIIAAFIVNWILQKTPLGYDIRALGANLNAARFRGINVSLVLIVTMVISGGLAGLAGTGEAFGIHHRLQMEISIGYGYTGIIVAVLAELNPLVTIITAIFFGGLINGSINLVTSIGVPTAIIYAMQAIILLFILAARVFTRYRIRRVYDVG